MEITSSLLPEKVEKRVDITSNCATVALLQTGDETMIRVIDRSNTHTIQKVSHNTKKGLRVHYQTIETALIGKGAHAVEHPTLREAREAIGKVEREFASRIFDKLGTLGNWFEVWWENAKDDSPTGRVVALADLLCVIMYVEHEWSLGNRSDQLDEIHGDCIKLIESKFMGTELEGIAMEAIK